MIGKVARMMAGRSLARKRGLSGGAGAVAGLLAPFVLKRVFSLMAKAGSAAADARRRGKGPKYLAHPLSEINPDRTGGR
jgi:hypothetical protein